MVVVHVRVLLMLHGGGCEGVTLAVRYKEYFSTAVPARPASRLSRLQVQAAAARQRRECCRVQRVRMVGEVGWNNSCRPDETDSVSPCLSPVMCDVMRCSTDQQQFFLRQN